MKFLVDTNVLLRLAHVDAIISFDEADFERYATIQFLRPSTFASSEEA